VVADVVDCSCWPVAEGSSRRALTQVKLLLACATTGADARIKVGYFLLRDE